MASFLDCRVLIAAFEDWGDAGKVSTTALRMLMEIFHAKPVKEIDADDYLDYHLYRPRCESKDGVRKIYWPAPTVYKMSNEPGVPSGSAEDIYFLISPEPNMRWRKFAVEIVDYAKANNIGGIIFLGSMLTDIPHTRPFPVFLTSEEPKVRYEIGVAKPSYEGPVSVASAIQEAARKELIDTLSLWAPVPHYTQGLPCPKALLALLVQVENLLSSSFTDQISLKAEVQKWEERVTQAASSDPRLLEYIKQLEELQDRVALSSTANDHLVKSLERYLSSIRRESEEFPTISRLRELPE